MTKNSFKKYFMGCHWAVCWLLPMVLIILTGIPLSSAEKAGVLSPVPLALPGGEKGIGFDDLGFSPELGKVIVPGGRTGTLFLIDPTTQEITAVPGFKAAEKYTGGHGEGVTSADAEDGFIFATDRSAGTVNIVDAATRKIAASAALASGPDYVRYSKTVNEVWVTEPDAERIEVFRLVKEPRPALRHESFISVPGGPEALVIDSKRQTAYTHLWEGATLAIDLKTRTIVQRWPNGCAGSRGIALDEERGFLFAGCAEGKAVVLALNHHAEQTGMATTGPGVDVIAYNSKLSHLYLTSSKDATLSILGVSPEGRLFLLGAGAAVPGAHCVTGDDHDHVWVCDPKQGRLLRYQDPFPANR